MKIIIYNENVMQNLPSHKKAYPKGMHNALRDIFDTPDNDVFTVTLSDIETGLSEEALSDCDLLLWWGHMAHNKVPDAVSDRVCRRVEAGMGAIFLHSAHMSKPFRALCGTPCTLRWREDGERERLWVTDPTHPIAEGVESGFRLPHEEMYGEFFNIPTPDSVVFTGWFEGGEVFRSGCCFHKGEGRFFYFQPGHETFPTYRNKNVRRILHNAALWATGQGPEKSSFSADGNNCPNAVFSPEPIHKLHRR